MQVFFRPPAAPAEIDLATAVRHLDPIHRGTMRAHAMTTARMDDPVASGSAQFGLARPRHARRAMTCPPRWGCDHGDSVG